MGLMDSINSTVGKLGSVAGKVNNAVRHTVDGTVTPYLSDEEGKARIGQFVTNFAKNFCHYACREGFKLIPGGGTFYKIVMQSIHGEKESEDNKEVIKALQERIDRLERESGGSTKSQKSEIIKSSL